VSLLRPARRHGWQIALLPENESGDLALRTIYVVHEHFLVEVRDSVVIVLAR